MLAAARRLTFRILALFRFKRLECELEDEIQFHLLMLAEAGVHRGLSPAEAQFAARRLFGSPELIKQMYRDGREMRPLANLMQDCRLALRILRTNPGFAFSIVGALSLSIAATILVGCLVEAVMRRPLPYPESDKILEIADFQHGREDVGNSDSTFEFVRANTQMFATLAAFEPISAPMYVTSSMRGAYASVARVTPSFFDVLRISPAIGKRFSEMDEGRAGAKAVILSHEVCSRLFGSDSHAIGNVIAINGDHYAVVGVMPPRLPSFPRADVLLAFHPITGYKANTCTIVGRLKENITVSAAEKELDHLYSDLRAKHPELVAGDHVLKLRKFRSAMAEDFRPVCFLLIGTVVLLHLTACLNSITLFLSRSFGRAREAAIRVALGASRLRILGQHLTESMFVAFLSGIFGLLLALATLPVLHALSIEGVDWNDVFVDPAILFFTFVIIVFSGLVAGGVPALLVSSVDPDRGMKEGRWRGDWSYSLIRKAFVLAEIALCVLLMCSAGLLVRYSAAARARNPGFDVRGLMTAHSPVWSDRIDSAAVIARGLRALDRISHLPGVAQVAIVTSLPLDGRVNVPVAVTDNSDFMPRSIEWRYVSGSYFHVVQVPLWRGRLFFEREDRPVAVINRQFARLIAGSQDVVGKRIQVGGGSKRGWNFASDPRFHDDVREIVGVVDDIPERGLLRPAPPTMFVPISQVRSELLRCTLALAPMSWVIRMRSPEDMQTDALRDQLSSIDNGLHFTDIRSMQNLFDESLRSYEWLAGSITACAFFTLALAIVGICGVISCSIKLRRRELAIGLALGAPRSRLCMSVAGEALLPTALGVLIGVLSALWLTSIVALYVFDTRLSGTAVLIPIVLLFTAAATLASIVPALRVSEIDPAAVLRCE